MKKKKYPRKKKQDKKIILDALYSEGAQQAYEKEVKHKIRITYCSDGV